MSLNQKRLVIGAHLSYSLLGAAITNSGGAAVTSTTVKPDGTTPGDWNIFATVVDCNIDNKRTEEDVHVPAPGAYQRDDILTTLILQGLDLTLNEVNELVLQSLLLSGTIGAGSVSGGTVTPATFSPGTTLGEVRGWFRLQNYAQNNSLILDWQFYGRAIVKSLKAENKHVMPKLEIAKFYNALESGSSSLIAAA